MKNQTANTKTNTNIFAELFTHRNYALSLGDLESNFEWQESCLELLDGIAITATYKTLNFLVSNGATTEKAVDDVNAKRNEKTPYGYNMALKLLQELPNDLTILRTNDSENAYNNAIDLIQEVRNALIPFVYLPIEINPDTVIYTKILKNGNEKDYNLFSLACNTIRKYIQSHAQKEYKKQAYCIGFTDEGKPIYTTKRPTDNLEDLKKEVRQAFLNQYGLTAKEQEVIAHYINGLKIQDIMPLVNMTFEATKTTLRRAKEKIKAIAQRNKMIKSEDKKQ